MKSIVDEHAPIKTMRVRGQDVPYMTKKWKAEARYRQNKTAENWEDKQKCRNEATNQRRLATKEYWKIKSEDLKRKPREFFRVF